MLDRNGRPAEWVHNMARCCPLPCAAVPHRKCPTRGEQNATLTLPGEERKDLCAQPTLPQHSSFLDERLRLRPVMLIFIDALISPMNSATLKERRKPRHSAKGMAQLIQLLDMTPESHERLFKERRGTVRPKTDTAESLTANDRSALPINPTPSAAPRKNVVIPTPSR